MGVETISLFGHGEPLLDKEIADKIQYCFAAGFDTFITTNGSLLDHETSYNILEAGLSHIRFSAHGIGDDYNNVHKGLNWDRFVENFKTFSHTLKLMESRCKISVSVIPMNGENINDIVKTWKPNCDYLEIWKPHNWTDGRNYRFLKVTQRKKTCGRPDSGPVQIQADGKVIVCCFDYDGKMVVGDTYKNTIEEILQCDAFDEIRRKHERGDHRGLICEACDQLNIEEESPLLYSSRDETLEAGRLSSTKFKLKE
jgi:MoaA/NifB/PqqE/SkfB family radical SAM enzyme